MSVRKKRSELKICLGSGNLYLLGDTVCMNGSAFRIEGVTVASGGVAQKLMSEVCL